MVRPPKVKRSTLNLVTYILIGFTVLWMMQSFVGPGPAEKIPYSEFLEFVKAGRVEQVEISNDEIKGLLRRGSVNEPGYQSIQLEGGQLIQAKRFKVVRIADDKLAELLQEHGVKFEGRIESDALMNFLAIWFFPLLVIVLFWGFIMRRMKTGGGLMTIGKSKAKVYVDQKPKTNFSDVAGIDEVVDELKEIVEYLRDPDRFRSLGGKIPKGVLLVGAPGTGKTLLARAIAGEAAVPFFSLSGSDFVEMFVGVGASRVRDLFEQAKAVQPCLVFIDELDALGRARSLHSFSGHDEREQTLNQLLVEMDGFEDNAGVILIGATNRPEILDIALLRPGRFDRRIVVDRPDIDGREAILKVHSRAVKLDSDVDLRIIAGRTPGFVGADLANIVNEAALLAARKGQKTVMMREFEEAIDRVVAGLERKNRVLNKREKEIVAYHESGHAIVAASLTGVDPLHRVSIIPRGIAALGHTLQLPTEDRYLMTRSELLARLKVYLGGRVAEEVVFGEISTGGQNDMERATGIARSMVAEFGMSEKLGPVAYRTRNNQYLPEMAFGANPEYSEATAREIDCEIRAVIDQVQEEVRAILRDKRHVLEELTNLLMEKEVVEGEALERFLVKHNLGNHKSRAQEQPAPVSDAPAESPSAERGNTAAPSQTE